MTLLTVRTCEKPATRGRKKLGTRKVKPDLHIVRRVASMCSRSCPMQRVYYSSPGVDCKNLL